MLGRRPLCRSASRSLEIVTVWIFMNRESYSVPGSRSTGSPCGQMSVRYRLDPRLKAPAEPVDVRADEYARRVIAEEARLRQHFLQYVVQGFTGGRRELHAL